MSSTLAPADPRAVRAWLVYRESLRGLEGVEYEQAEARGWERLELVLADLEHEARAPDAPLG